MGVDALGVSCPWAPTLTEDGSGDWDIFFGSWMSGKHKIENRNNAVKAQEENSRRGKIMRAYSKNIVTPLVSVILSCNEHYCNVCVHPHISTIDLLIVVRNLPFSVICHSCCHFNQNHPKSLPFSISDILHR